VLIRVMIMR